MLVATDIARAASTSTSCHRSSNYELPNVPGITSPHRPHQPRGASGQALSLVMQEELPLRAGVVTAAPRGAQRPAPRRPNPAPRSDRQVAVRLKGAGPAANQGGNFAGGGNAYRGVNNAGGGRGGARRWPRGQFLARRSAPSTGQGSARTAWNDCAHGYRISSPPRTGGQS